MNQEINEPMNGRVDEQMNGCVDRWMGELLFSLSYFFTERVPVLSATSSLSSLWATSASQSSVSSAT